MGKLKQYYHDELVARSHPSENPFGVYKIKLIKYVRDNTGMGLKEARDVVMAVYDGKSLDEVFDMCEDNTPKYIIEDMYKLAMQDKFETQEVQKTTMGRYLYV